MNTIVDFTNFINQLKNLVFLLGLTFSDILFCQAPDLGVCSTFAVFSAVGAIDNVNATTIYGDVGTDVGAFNGFPPGLINGEIHVADAVSAEAAIDVDLLYTYLNSLSCDSTIATILGNNQSLVPNIYCLGAASSLFDTSIFDGQGNNDALFIIKIDGALTTSIYSTIILVNQAQAKNIFWQINGLFNLDGYSIFKGTVVTDGAISLLSNSEIEGRILSRAGAISLESNAIVMNFNDAPLPIELLTFHAECQNNKALLKWQTASESSNDYFTLEQSLVDQKWTFIAEIEGAGNSTSLQNYAYLVDTSEINKTKYFRLKQTDFDGHHSYSWIIILENCAASPQLVELYPNPTNQTLFFNYSGDLSEFISLKIVNAIGEDFENHTSFQPVVDLSVYPSGTYFFQIQFKDVTVIQKIVVLN